jgi:hypothetical protein
VGGDIQTFAFFLFGDAQTDRQVDDHSARQGSDIMITSTVATIIHEVSPLLGECAGAGAAAAGATSRSCNQAPGVKLTTRQGR